MTESAGGRTRSHRITSFTSVFLVTCGLLAGRRAGLPAVAECHHGNGAAGHGRCGPFTIVDRARAHVGISQQAALLHRIRRARCRPRPGQVGAERPGSGALAESQRRVRLADIGIAGTQGRVAATDPLFAAMNGDRRSAAGFQIIGLFVAAGAQASRRCRAASYCSHDRRRLPVGRVTRHRAGNTTGSSRNERQPEGTTEKRTDDSVTENRASGFHRRQYNDLALSSNEHRRSICRLFVGRRNFRRHDN